MVNQRQPLSQIWQRLPGTAEQRVNVETGEIISRRQYENIRARELTGARNLYEITRERQRGAPTISEFRSDRALLEDFDLYESSGLYHAWLRVASDMRGVPIISAPFPDSSVDLVNPDGSPNWHSPDGRRFHDLLARMIESGEWAPGSTLDHAGGENTERFLAYIGLRGSQRELERQSLRGGDYPVEMGINMRVIKQPPARYKRLGTAPRSLSRKRR